MKRIVLSFIMLTNAGLILAQSAEKDVFHFRYIERKLDESEIKDELLQEHFLGETIAKKIYLLKESYTWEEAETATNPGTSVWVEKPTIYYSIRKLERFYKKAVKKEEIPAETARKEFEEILNVALLIRDQQTTDFENMLKEQKDEKGLIAAFTEKVVLEHY